MSLKHELQVWVSALQAFDAGDYDAAVAQFEEIAYYSKILFNLAMIHAIRGQHERAIADFARSIALDPFFAVAHFQLGVSAFLIGQFVEAKKSFDRALALFRENHTIDYRQLGLDHRLFSCEVKFNRGLSQIYAGKLDLGMQDLLSAQADKQSSVHDVIDEAISDQALGYTVFSVPVGVVFRPQPYKVENLETRDYLGKARVVAATDPSDLFAGFAGARPPIERAESDRQPTRSNTSAGRLQSSQARRPDEQQPVNSGEGVLTRSRTAPALRSAATSVETPAAVTNAAPGSDGDGASSSAPVAFEKTDAELQGPVGSRPSRTRRSPSNAQAPAAKSLARSRSFTSRPRIPPNDAFYSATPSRPATRPPPLDLGLLQPPGSPGHRRSASSPALLSPASSALPDDRVGPNNSLAALPPQGAALAPLALATDPSEVPKPAIVPDSARDTDASAALHASPDAAPDQNAALMRTASKAEAGRPALARLGLRLQTVDLAGGEALASAVTSSPRSMTTLARGELYDSYAAMSTEPAAINKFRVRLKRRGETRAMSLSGEVTLTDLLDRVRSKLATSGNLMLQFTDADGGSVLLKDEEDWQCALDVAREAAVPPAWTGRLDIDVVEG